MLVVLSQKIDPESSYEDKLFSLYHYPARYKNQIHEGDLFIYYQGNRYSKSQRYYFGTGTIGEIKTSDGENYYARLSGCERFKKTVPIYLPDGGYIEQLGYLSVRKNLNPPWQCSVRPISQEAFNYILNAAEFNMSHEPDINAQVEELKGKLKTAIKEFYLDGNISALDRIESISVAIKNSFKQL